MGQADLSPSLRYSSVLPWREHNPKSASIRSIKLTSTTNMVHDNKIIEELRTVEQYRFERLIDNLLYQGAFHDIVPKNSFLEPFGTNIEKERTIKSAPRADAEVRLSGTIIEKSVNENWGDKFKEDIEKNKGKKVKRFIFCSNQDTSTKMIYVNRKPVDAIDYCKNELPCDDCYIIGSNDLVLALQNPDFFFIRRSFLNISEDVFNNPSDFLRQLRASTPLQAPVDQARINEYCKSITKDFSFSPGEIVVLHSDSYVTLLHALGLWATGQTADDLIVSEYCFINWPRRNIDLKDIDHREIRDDIDSFLFIWGAHSIENLTDYLKFYRRKVSLIFVTQSSYKDDQVIGKLRSFGGNLNIRNVTIPPIEEHVVPASEVRQHETTIRAIAERTGDLLLQLEAVIYFNSPLYIDDQAARDKICQILGLSAGELSRLMDILRENDLADITGRLFWLKKPGVAKALLDDFITKNIISIERLL